MIFREIQELFTYHSRYCRHFANHDCYNVYRKAIKELHAKGFTEIVEKRVLDLGCGQRFPFAFQCVADGAIVTALDIDYIKPDSLPLFFFKTVQHNGIKRSFKSILRRIVFDTRYYKFLELASGKPLRPFRYEIDFVISDPHKSNYTLPSDSFDLIFSNAVLEHVADLSHFVTEVRRMLSLGGLFYGFIHNFYSLSGGHNLEWAFPEENPSKKVPPWDHLRKNLYPSWVYLNRLRPAEYMAAFSCEFDILLFEGRNINHDPVGYEGEQFLTPGIASELATYPRELLLTRAWCLICRKSK